MANNRMWLVHRPSGKAVFLGKRLGSEWSGTPKDVSDRISVLFDVAENHDYGLARDDFCLAMEDCTGAPFAFDNWQYTTTGEVPLTSMKIG